MKKDTIKSLRIRLAKIALTNEIGTLLKRKEFLKEKFDNEQREIRRIKYSLEFVEKRLERKHNQLMGLL